MPSKKPKKTVPRLTKNARLTLESMADADGYLYRKSRKKPSLRIFPDGTIVRVDVPLDMAKKLTVKEALKFLAL